MFQGADAYVRLKSTKTCYKINERRERKHMQRNERKQKIGEERQKEKKKESVREREREKESITEKSCNHNSTAMEKAKVKQRAWEAEGKSRRWRK